MNRREQMRLVDEGIAILEQLNSGAMSRKAEMSAVDRMLEIVELIGGGSAKPDISSVPQNIKEAALAILLYGKGVSSVWGLAGDKMADARQKIMSLFAGFQVAKSKSGVNAILEQIKDNIGEHDFSSARESSIEDKIIDAWLMSTSQGIVFDVGAFKKGNQLNRDASDFGKQKDSYGFLGSYIGVDKASKFLKFSTEPKWAFAITESQKIKIGYTDGQENVSWVDGDFDTLESAYQALQSNEDYQNLINTKDFTPLLNSIINGDVNVFDDSTKLTELVGATQEVGGDDMPEDKKGLFIEAITAAGIQQLEGLSFELVD